MWLLTTRSPVRTRLGEFLFAPLHPTALPLRPGRGDTNLAGLRLRGLQATHQHCPRVPRTNCYRACQQLLLALGLPPYMCTRRPRDHMPTGTNLVARDSDATPGSSATTTGHGWTGERGASVGPKVDRYLSDVPSRGARARGIPGRRNWCERLGRRVRDEAHWCGWWEVRGFGVSSWLMWWMVPIVVLL